MTSVPPLRLTVGEAIRQAIDFVYDDPSIRLRLAKEIVDEWMRHPAQGIDEATGRLLTRIDATRATESPEHVLQRLLGLLAEDWLRIGQQ